MTIARSVELVPAFITREQMRAMDTEVLREAFAAELSAGAGVDEAEIELTLTYRGHKGLTTDDGVDWIEAIVGFGVRGHALLETVALRDVGERRYESACLALATELREPGDNDLSLFVSEVVSWMRTARSRQDLSDQETEHLMTAGVCALRQMTLQSLERSIRQLRVAALCLADRVGEAQPLAGAVIGEETATSDGALYFAGLVLQGHNLADAASACFRRAYEAAEHRFAEELRAVAAEAASEQTDSDEREAMRKLIADAVEEKLQPAVNAVNEHITLKLEGVNRRLDAIIIATQQVFDADTWAAMRASLNAADIESVGRKQIATLISSWRELDEDSQQDIVTALGVGESLKGRAAWRCPAIGVIVAAERVARSRVAQPLAERLEQLGQRAFGEPRRRLTVDHLRERASVGDMLYVLKAIESMPTLARQLSRDRAYNRLLSSSADADALNKLRRKAAHPKTAFGREDWIESRRLAATLITRLLGS